MMTKRIPKLADPIAEGLRAENMLLRRDLNLLRACMSSMREKNARLTNNLEKAALKIKALNQTISLLNQTNEE